MDAATKTLRWLERSALSLNMTWRVLSRFPRPTGGLLKCCPSWQKPITPRCLSTHYPCNHLQLSCSTPIGSDGPSLRDLSSKMEVVGNPDGHDAAVVLATPLLARYVMDDEFVGRIARLLSQRNNFCQFHLLCAVVDHLAPVSCEPGSTYPLQGLSVLRGHLDDILPALWASEPPAYQVDAEYVAALSFELGRPRITLPLSRTIFQNHRPSTLVASLFHVTQDSLRLTRKAEKRSQRVRISSSQPPRSVHDLGLRALLSPVTFPRVVTESFGNIVRSISVGGEPAPASMELEESIEVMSKNRPAMTPGPLGVWALVMPKDYPISAGNIPNPTVILQGEHVTPDMAMEAVQQIEKLYKLGGRLFQILSGGGGWGSKKGLLSIDPQRTHGPLSDEEEMTRFMDTMKCSDFAPPGAHVQFFVAPDISGVKHVLQSPSIVFGIPGAAEVMLEAEVLPVRDVVTDHFGALSYQGIFIEGPVEPDADVTDHFKLNIPRSHVLYHK